MTPESLKRQGYNEDAIDDLIRQEQKIDEKNADEITKLFDDLLIEEFLKQPQMEQKV